jgi:hypothetical protein
MAIKLRHIETQKAVNVGDVLADFRGDRLTITGWPTDGRNRVYTRDEQGREREYFPSVVNCELVEG